MLPTFFSRSSVQQLLAYRQNVPATTPTPLVIEITDLDWASIFISHVEKKFKEMVKKLCWVTQIQFTLASTEHLLSLHASKTSSSPKRHENQTAFTFSTPENNVPFNIGRFTDRIINSVVRFFQAHPNTCFLEFTLTLTKRPFPPLSSVFIIKKCLITHNNFD